MKRKCLVLVWAIVGLANPASPAQTTPSVAIHLASSEFRAGAVALGTAPSAGAAWIEDWEASTLAVYTPTQPALTAIVSGRNRWLLSDTASNFEDDDGPTPNRAQVLLQDGSRVLRLMSNRRANGDSSGNIFVGLLPSVSGLSIPISPATRVAMAEKGALENPEASRTFPCVLPPCADTVHLDLIDNRGNQVTYIFQRPADYTEHTIARYTEVFLPTEGGALVRDLFSDFSRIPGWMPDNASVVGINFQVDDTGWATLDNLRIGELTGIEPPVITEQPASREVALGGTATFVVAATGTAPLSYQWYFQGQPLAGASHASLILANVQGSQAGTYAVVVGNAGGRVTSYAAALAVLAPPTIARQPSDREVLEGAAVEFNVVAGGSGPLTFEWWHDGSAIPAANADTLKLERVRDVDAGKYTVRVSNRVGSAMSDPAMLTVGFLPLRIVGTAHETGRFTMAWIGGRGPYRLQRRVNLTEGSWEDAAAGLLGTNLTLELEPTAMSFYRVLGREASRPPGTLLWQFPTRVLGCSAALGREGMLYVPDYDSSKLYALETTRGSKRWEFTAERPIQSSPAVGPDGTVYVGSWDGRLYALNGLTGALRWKFETGDRVYDCSPAIGRNGWLYFGSQAGVFHAVDTATGSERWRYMCGGGIRSSPALGVDGLVCFGSMDGKIHGLDALTGGQRWEVATGGQVTASPAIGADGTVFVGSHDAQLRALDGATGTERWSVRLVRMVGSSAAIGADGTVYLGSNYQRIYAFEAKTGLKKWEFQTGETYNSFASPAVSADGTVYVGCVDGQFYALDGRTGAKQWSYGADPEIGYGSPTIGPNGVVYCGDGHALYAWAGSGSDGPAASSWPMFRQNAQHTGQVPLP